MKIIITELNLKRYDVIQCHTQVGHITTNLKVKINFTLPRLSATKTVTWNCH